MGQIRGLARERTSGPRKTCNTTSRTGIDQGQHEHRASDAEQSRPEGGAPCALIRNNLAAPLTVGDIAGQLQLSRRSRVRAPVHRSHGVSPQRSGTSLRMQLARKLLATTRLSDRRHSSQVGYSDPSQFSKYFTRRPLQRTRFRRSFPTPARTPDRRNRRQRVRSPPAAERRLRVGHRARRCSSHARRCRQQRPDGPAHAPVVGVQPRDLLGCLSAGSSSPRSKGTSVSARKPYMGAVGTGLFPHSFTSKQVLVADCRSSRPL